MSASECLQPSVTGPSWVRAPILRSFRRSETVFWRGRRIPKKQRVHAKKTDSALLASLEADGTCAHQKSFAFATWSGVLGNGSHSTSQGAFGARQLPILEEFRNSQRDCVTDAYHAWEARFGHFQSRLWKILSASRTNGEAGHRRGEGETAISALGNVVREPSVVQHFERFGWDPRARNPLVILATRQRSAMLS